MSIMVRLTHIRESGELVAEEVEADIKVAFDEFGQMVMHLDVGTVSGITFSLADFVDQAVASVRDLRSVTEPGLP